MRHMPLILKRTLKLLGGFIGNGEPPPPLCTRLPEKILTDRGSQFTSKLFQRMAKRLVMKKVFTTAYHPQTGMSTCQALPSHTVPVWSIRSARHRTTWFTVVTKKLPTSVIFGSKTQLRHDAQQYGLDLTEGQFPSSSGSTRERGRSTCVRNGTTNRTSRQTMPKGSLCCYLGRKHNQALRGSFSASDEGHFGLFRRQRR